MSSPEQIVREFARKYPTPASHPNGGDGDWDQDCGAAMSRLCLAYGKEPTGDVHSAYKVYTRSRIVSRNPTLALPGDFHFWDIAGPGNGHTSFEVFGAGRDTFMANRRVRSIEGAKNLGFLSVADYTRLSGAVYLGFSHGYADGDVTKFSVPKPTSTVTSTESDKAFVRRVSRYLNRRVLGIDTNAEKDGVRGKAYWTEIQTAGRQDGLYGKDYRIDGEPGPRSRWLERHYGLIA
jgi:hypothetical protein